MLLKNNTTYEEPKTWERNSMTLIIYSHVLNGRRETEVIHKKRKMK